MVLQGVPPLVANPTEIGDYMGAALQMVNGDCDEVSGDAGPQTWTCGVSTFFPFCVNTVSDNHHVQTNATAITLTTFTN
jgi:hypothetical protein